MVTGQILVYRVFDVGPDFNLEQVERQLSNLTATQRARLSRPTRSVHIANAPLCFSMGQTDLLDRSGFKVDIQIKVWPFGAISTVLVLNIENQPWSQWIELGTEIESAEFVTTQAADIVRQVLKWIDHNREPQIDVIEDYMIYFFKSLPGCEQDALMALDLFDLPKLLMTENSGSLSLQVQKMIRESVIQYNRNDLAAITWNSALVIEPSGVWDIPDIIEFALIQVLEMRYYDYLLEKKLTHLYDSLEQRQSGLFRNQAERLSQEAAKHYLEISETVENVENSLKVIGDFYLAQIFRAASTRFRFQDWRASVNQKLRNLTEISQLINNNVNARRSHGLELVIIILIAIEVIPFILSFWQSSK